MESKHIIADEKVAKLGPAVEPPALEADDEVYLYRPLSATAKASQLPYVGPYRVIASNQHIIKIIDKDNKSDWVHRNHVFKKQHRNPDLQLHSILPMLENMAPPLQGLEPKDDGTPQITHPTNPVSPPLRIPVIDEITIHDDDVDVNTTTDNVNQQCRRSSRNRRPTSRLNIADTGNPSYI